MDMMSKQERLILGTDRWDAEEQIDLWLAQNPEIKIIRIHEMRREPSSLLTFIGGRNVPRVSVMVEYQTHEEDAQTDARHSPTVAPAENNDCEEYADGGRDQSAR
jgi:ribosomal protein S4E